MSRDVHDVTCINVTSSNAIGHLVKTDAEKDMHYDLRWDDAGNLGQVSMANEEAMFKWGQFLFWTEDNHMHASVDEKHYTYYAYDHTGERRLKLSGDSKVLDVNADFMNTYTILDNPTLYPSAYMVVSNKGYTKHYYAGAERVAARIGGGGLGDSFMVGNDTLVRKADSLFKQSWEQVNGRRLEQNNPDCINSEEEYFHQPIVEIPEHVITHVDFDYGQWHEVIPSLAYSHSEPEVYYYHSDHLGSASWISDNTGTPIQHLQYLPFGERYIDQRTSGYSERFTFTGKERDEETGYTYHGARYYDASLMCSWFSVDPMSDKYPSLSPNNYCAWNPVKLVDLDGRDTIRINLSTGEIEQSLGGNLCEIINNDEIIYSLNCNIMYTTYMANARGKNKLVGKNEFEHSEDDQKVFGLMSKLASDENTRMPTEWDYYSLSDGTGHLLTSFQEGEVRSRQSDYTNDNVISFDHYHPYQRNSAIPSKSDFDHRDRINDGPNTVTCRLHTGGKSYCFNGLKRDDRNGVLINSILSIALQMKEVVR